MTKDGCTEMRNTAVKQLLVPEPEPQLTRSAQELSAEVCEALPPKTGPTSLGNATLTPAPAEELQGEELARWLRLEGLSSLKNMPGIGWRAHKVKTALERNSKLINPELEYG